MKAGEQAGRIAADVEALEHYEGALIASRQADSSGLDAVMRARLDSRIGAALWRLGRHDAAVQHSKAAIFALGVSYPTSQREFAGAFTLKTLKRAWRYVSRATEDDPPFAEMTASDARLTSLSEALETIANVEYYRSPLRFVVAVLIGADVSEGRPSQALAVNTSTLGMICDSLGFSRIARRTHGRGIRIAESLRDDVAMGYCLLFLGMHEYGVGSWSSAIDTFSNAAAHCEVAGHIRNWLRSNGMKLLVLRSMGSPEWVEPADKQLEVATAAQDEHAIGWARNLLGVRDIYRGKLEAAISNFEKACAIYEAIRDHRYLPGAMAGLALCLARRGRAAHALAVLERSRNVSAKYRVGGLLATQAVLFTAEAYLCAAEASAGERRKQALKPARRAVAAAVRHGRRVRDESRAEALRLGGIYQWLTGDKARAMQLWRLSIDVADELGAKYVAAKARYDIGIRTDDPALVAAATSLFEWARAVPPDVETSTCSEG